MSDSLKDFIAGCVGGFAGKLLDYPFDTIKVLLQTQNVTSKQHVPSSGTPAPVMYRGAWHCFNHTLQTKGFLGLYNGLSAPLLGSMGENAILFFAYGNFKTLLGEVPGKKELSLLELSMAGAGSKGSPNGLPVDEWGIRVNENSQPVGSCVARGGATNGPAAVY